MSISAESRILMLTSPLFTDWREQYVTLGIPGLGVGEAVQLLLDGQPAPFQYTGRLRAEGAEVMVRLGFTKGQQRTLAFSPIQQSTTVLERRDIPLDGTVTIGISGRQLRLKLSPEADGSIGGPLGDYAGFPLQSRIQAERALEGVTLTETNSGPLFCEYQLQYRYEQSGFYTVTYRFYRDEPLLEIGEEFLLGMGAVLTASINPCGVLDRIVSHTPFDFEGDTSPVVEALGIPRPKDVLCRLQMPAIGEYTVPNNRGWFALFSEAERQRGMLGLVGLYGDRWRAPVANIMQFSDVEGRVFLHAALEEGERHWMLVTGPVETEITADHSYIFNRLYAQFNQLRLGDHLDLTGETIFDANCWQAPGLLGENWQQTVQDNVARFPELEKLVQDSHMLLAALGIEVASKTQSDALTAMRDKLLERFRRWVVQFQGYRFNQNDYSKNVIGFSRMLRSLMLEYELLRKTGFLTEDEVRQCSAYFCFAARRIMDEGRWPHSKTTLHPLHPDSTRGLYTYPGEHIPDRLYWTNCLPNFQSDPLCALIQLSCLMADHPDARKWLRKGIDDLESQLSAYCGKSGAWEESINYALFTFSYLIITIRVLKNRTGINYFQDARMRAFAGWLTRFIARRDKRFGDVATWPGIGNSRLPHNNASYLLAYSGELEESDPLREACLAVYQLMTPGTVACESDIPYLLLMPPPLTREYTLPRLTSENMDEVGVAMRHGNPSPNESYLFQKIGFAKDHYEGDESSFNWYAKGTPLTMEYSTYTGDAGGWNAHNLIEIPDMDGLTRGYLGDSFFSETIDYTRCELPVVLKLLHGRIRSFTDIDGPPQKPLFFYIGDENPVGPKCWKKRLLLFVKPDYLLILDRVFGAVPHRYNLHVVADGIERNGRSIHCHGRYNLDLACFVQHPAEFRLETGELQPAPNLFGVGDANPHRQQFFRLYNETGGVYRTALFAQERGRDLTIEPAGNCGVKVTTPEYTDYAFISDEMAEEAVDGMRFSGRVGWIRQMADGQIQAAMPDGDLIQAFGTCLDGMGPWSYNLDGAGQFDVRGVPRTITRR